MSLKEMGADTRGSRAVFRGGCRSRESDKRVNLEAQMMRVPGDIKAFYSLRAACQLLKALYRICFG
jgi:hypothetical protein